MKKSPTQEPPMSENEKLREALENAEQQFEAIRKILINNLAEPERQAFWKAVCARDAAREALSTPPSEADADEVRQLAKLFRQHHRDTCYPEAMESEANAFARAALSAIQSRDAGLREALEQAATWFEEYAVEHYAKAKNASSSGEQHGREVKGKTNRERAAFLRTALSTPCVEQDGDEVTRIERILRKHIVCDATGLSPTVASVFLQGFREAAVEILSTPPSKADADDVERVAMAFAEALYGEQFDPFIEPEAYAHVEEATRTVLSAIQNRDAGLRKALEAAAYLIGCLDAVSRGVPRNLDEAWERYGNARAALQMGGEKP